MKNFFKKCLVPLFLALATSVTTFISCGDKTGGSPSNVGGYEGIDTGKTVSSIVENGATDYKIVVSQNASECETYAAEELQSYVKKVTGVTINIVDDKGVTLGDKLISVGKTELSKTLDTTDLNTDGFRLKTEDETLLIKGERDRGTLYGVYDFCEKYLGCKFVSADMEYVPTLEQITLYESDVIEIPDFATRSVNDPDIRMDLGSSAKMRLVALGNSSGKASAKYGGGYLDDWANGMHSFNGLVSYDENKELHSDWFSKNTTSSTEGDPYPQWCLSNGLTDDGEIAEEGDTLAKAAIKALKELILSKPDAIYIGLGQNDNRNHCTCAGCVHQRELFGGFGAHQVVFVNAVSEKVDEWLQSENIDRKLTYATYAYMQTFDPPKQDAERADLVKTRDNVYVMVCPYDDYFNVPLNDMEHNFNFANGVTNWSKVTNNFFVFDYGANFSDYLTWYPNLDCLKTNVVWYKQLGAVGVTMDGCISGSYRVKLQEYLLSKLYWDVDQDTNALISEFNAVYFGQAAGEVMDDFVAFNSAWFYHAATKDGGMLKTGIYRKDWTMSTDTLSVDYIRQLQRYVDEATNLIKDDSTISSTLQNTYLKNLARAQVMIDFMQYYNYNALFKTTDEKKMEFMRAFYDRLTMLRISDFGKKHDSVQIIFSNMGIY